MKKGEQADLTRSLAQSLGLLSAEGLPLYQDEQLEKWKRRMAVVQTKLQRKVKTAKKNKRITTIS
ncbi:hypothetical protein BFS30_17950 [Pedobacter steynii]|uniref:Uncharacterized protein n=1 Tax=Pedobacter steynii TaxID=430522 RepID=A0A1D7QJN2_9SPHI|nr:hypothetical protein BFS30_17950 [Pedobacter steynii]